MRVPDPFSCLFNVAASRAQIATIERGRVSTAAAQSQRRQSARERTARPFFAAFVDQFSRLIERITQRFGVGRALLLYDRRPGSFGVAARAGREVRQKWRETCCSHWVRK